MISAYFAAASGESVILLEKNGKLGKKLYITGKGRCNVTNDCRVEDFLSNVVSNPKFLTGAAMRFTPSDFMEFIGSKTKLKVERGNRVFPVSDKASDITKCLESYLSDAGVCVRLGEEVKGISVSGGAVSGVYTDKEEIKCDRAIVCTGGLSYPSTGSTGDGYRFAAAAGHNVIPPKPALVGIDVKDDFRSSLQGVSLKNVTLSAMRGDKKIYSGFGEMMFTHFGISGPIVLSASSILNRENMRDIRLFIDLKPALTEEQLDARILRDFEKYKNKLVINSLDDLLIRSLIPAVTEKSGTDCRVKNSDFKRSERQKLVSVIKAFPLTPVSLRGVEEAIVTAGGVDVKEVDPKTMESKIVRGLYFAGEVLDVDCLTGGFNITACAMTAYAAGNAEKRRKTTDDKHRA